VAGSDLVGASDVREVGGVAVQRLDHVGVVVPDLDAAVAFFVELGLQLVGSAATPVEGQWVDRVVGLEGVQVDIAFVATPDGHGRLELTRFRHPDLVASDPSPPANTLGLRRLMFAVDDLDDVVARLRAHGGELIGQIAQYEDVYRLCYLRGPGGVIVALAEEVRRSATAPRTA
jgi:catechol 2,3-dioxygenase-like lactoylglutathione lyase family enzyme